MSSLAPTALCSGCTVPRIAAKHCSFDTPKRFRLQIEEQYEYAQCRPESGLSCWTQELKCCLCPTYQHTSSVPAGAGTAAPQQLIAADLQCNRCKTPSKAYICKVHLKCTPQMHVPTSRLAVSRSGACMVMPLDLQGHSWCFGRPRKRQTSIEEAVLPHNVCCQSA